MSHWVQLGDGLPWEMELQMSPTEIPTFLLVPWGLWPDGMSSPSGKGGTVRQGKDEGSQLRVFHMIISIKSGNTHKEELRIMPRHFKYSISISCPVVILLPLNNLC